MFATFSIWSLHYLVQLAFIIRILLRRQREPASRIAWVVLVAVLPVVGILAYVLLGETNVGRRNLKAMQEAVSEAERRRRDAGSAGLPDIPQCVPAAYRHLFSVGFSISGMQPVAGNTGTLMEDSNSTIDSMVADIDAAREQVNALFYIWLTDNNGEKIAAALMRAAGRGIRCNAMVDGLGSRSLLQSELWPRMTEAGVHTAIALPLGRWPLRPLSGRIDLRNHRKILVIDRRITYCGSQNCADPEFAVKARYAPWVDAVIRFEGAVARQNQIAFATDWMTYTGEVLEDSVTEAAAIEGEVVAQVIASGPIMRGSAIPELFESLIYSAREELIISTPYYVPSQSMQAALRAAGHRGVKVQLILPANNDSREVAAASRSYYEALLEAGVELWEFVGGLLHSKTLTVDGGVTLIGSANMDRRSFDLNFENNILFYNPQLTRCVQQRQRTYIESANRVCAQDVAEWSMGRRLWNNTVAMLGPVL
jgi:cardiolipin synthase